jgi:hypothetical protein
VICNSTVIATASSDTSGIGTGSAEWDGRSMIGKIRLVDVNGTISGWSYGIGPDILSLGLLSVCILNCDSVSAPYPCGPRGCRFLCQIRWPSLLFDGGNLWDQMHTNSPGLISGASHRWVRALTPIFLPSAVIHETSNFNGTCSPFA